MLGFGKVVTGRHLHFLIWGIIARNISRNGTINDRVIYLENNLIYITNIVRKTPTRLLMEMVN